MGVEVTASPVRMIAEWLQFVLLIAIIWVVAMGWGKRKGFVSNLLSERAERIGRKLEISSHAEENLTLAQPGRGRTPANGGSRSQATRQGRPRRCQSDRALGTRGDRRRGAPDHRAREGRAGHRGGGDALGVARGTCDHRGAGLTFDPEREDERRRAARCHRAGDRGESRRRGSSRTYRTTARPRRALGRPPGPGPRREERTACVRHGSGDGPPRRERAGPTAPPVPGVASHALLANAA